MDPDASHGHTASYSPLFVTYQQLLRERLDALLTSSLSPHLYTDVVTALEGRSKLLSKESGTDSPSGVWSLLTFLLTMYLAPKSNSSVACNAALALECYDCSIDLLDDVMDEDQTPTLLTLGIARTLSTADALRGLANEALRACYTEADSFLLPTLLLTFDQASLAIAAGQTQDILTEHIPFSSVSLDSCIALAAAKTGSMFQLACRLAAVCAHASDDLYQKLSLMGELLGIAHQLDNDADDLYDLVYPVVGRTPSGKNDLLRGKKTLPIVYAMQDSALGSELSLLSETSRDALYTAILQTRSVSALYRSRARTMFQHIDREVHEDATLLRVLLHL